MSERQREVQERSVLAQEKSGYKLININELCAGTVIYSPVYEQKEERSILLLSAGTRITEQLIDKLRRREVERVRVEKSDWARMELQRRKGLQLKKLHRKRGKNHSATSKVAPVTWKVGPRSLIHKIKRRGAVAYDGKIVEETEGKFQESVTQTINFFNELKNECRVQDKELFDMAERSIEQLIKDLDIFVSVGLQPNTGEYPGQHSVQASMLALSIGTTLGLRKDELIELVTGCVLHDVGMLFIDPEIYRAPVLLDPIDFLEITKHPTYAFDLSRRLDGLSTGARMIAYQMHERCNGSGYPRKRRKEQIHHLARIAAVADTFVAMISPRPYRPAYVPYHALEEIIRATRSKQFDAEVVRALLETVSLFPIGSFVKLNDGRVGEVIRANGKQYTRPIIKAWHPGDSSNWEVVDLAVQPELSVKQVLPNLENKTESVAAAELDLWE